MVSRQRNKMHLPKYLKYLCTPNGPTCNWRWISSLTPGMYGWMRTESNQDRFVATPSTVPARDLKKSKNKRVTTVITMTCWAEYKFLQSIETHQHNQRKRGKAIICLFPRNWTWNLTSLSVHLGLEVWPAWRTLAGLIPISVASYRVQPANH